MRWPKLGFPPTVRHCKPCELSAYEWKCFHCGEWMEEGQLAARPSSVTRRNLPVEDRDWHDRYIHD